MLVFKFLSPGHVVIPTPTLSAPLVMVLDTTLLHCFIKKAYQHSLLKRQGSWFSPHSFWKQLHAGFCPIRSLRMRHILSRFPMLVKTTSMTLNPMDTSVFTIFELSTAAKAVRHNHHDRSLLLPLQQHVLWVSSCLAGCLWGVPWCLRYSLWNNHNKVS